MQLVASAGDHFISTCVRAARLQVLWPLFSLKLLLVSAPCFLGQGVHTSRRFGVQDAGAVGKTLSQPP